jgi:CotS family spore coat protein
MEGTFLSEIDIEVLSLYDIEIDKMYKGRDSFIIQQGKSVYKLMPFNGSESRIKFLEEMLDKLKASGYGLIDSYIYNKEGTIITSNELQEKYIVKTCVSGNECDVKNTRQILKSVEALARLHNALNKIELSMVIPETTEMVEEYDKHCKELKKVKNYIRSRKRKTAFEYDMLSKYDEFYEMACDTLVQLKSTHYHELERSAIEKGCICHGNYNYHNVIIDGDDVNIINFEKAGLGLQIKDLYFFMRKIMEKHNWNLELGASILETYNCIKPIKQTEHNILMLMLQFPEKFWKVVNQYYNSNKSWIPDKNVEKLNMVYVQQHRKEIFIEKILNR